MTKQVSILTERQLIVYMVYNALKVMRLLQNIHQHCKQRPITFQKLKQLMNCALLEHLDCTKKKTLLKSCRFGNALKKDKLKPAFIDSKTNQLKKIQHIRVDGSHDEGPFHCEVQYWWTVRHLKAKAITTIITCRNKGASFCNGTSSHKSFYSLNVEWWSFEQWKSQSEKIGKKSFFSYRCLYQLHKWSSMWTNTN